jgi:hypothetical protein
MIEEANAINRKTFSQTAGVDASVGNFDHGIPRGQTEGDPYPVFWFGY